LSIYGAKLGAATGSMLVSRMMWLPVCALIVVSFLDTFPSSLSFVGIIGLGYVIMDDGLIDTSLSDGKVKLY
jgi:hypothetical protein